MATATPPASSNAAYPADAIARLIAPPETEHPAPKLRRLLREAPGDLRPNRAPLPENWADHLERAHRDEDEQQEGNEREHRHHRTDAQHEHERDRGGDDAADHLHQSGADEIAHSFDVVHDARDQHTRFGAVEVGDRQADHVTLDLDAELTDQLVRLHTEKLGEQESGHRLQRDRPADRQHQNAKQTEILIRDHVVDQVLRGAGKDQTGEAVDQDQEQPEEQQP